MSQIIKLLVLAQLEVTVDISVPYRLQNRGKFVKICFKEMGTPKNSNDRFEKMKVKLGSLKPCKGVLYPPEV